MGLVKRAVKFTGVVLTGVGGFATLIFGIGQEGMAAVAFIGISLVLLAFFAYIAIALIARVVGKLQGYDSAVTQAGVALEALEEAKKELEGIPVRLKEERHAGRLDSIGAMLANRSGAVLRVRGMKMVEGNLVVVATLEDGECPAMGSRFLLRSFELGTRRGIVAVDGLDERENVLLTVIEKQQGSGAFWREAHNHADVTESTPGKLELVPDPLIAEITEGAEI